MRKYPATIIINAVVTLSLGTSRVNAAAKASDITVLQPKTYRHYIEQFNKSDGDKDPDGAAFPNSKAWSFVSENCPLFDCPDKEVEKTYYYRWWVYRKHIKKESGRFVISEFIKRPPICARQAEQKKSCLITTNQLTYLCRHFCGLEFCMRLAVLGGVLAVPYTRNPL